MIAVKFIGIGKKYVILHEKEAIVRHILPRFLKVKSFEEFWALKDLSLDIERGETLGIMGSNGAGKTTLLNIISGITTPTEGRIFVNGKVSALLSLGAGFHPELTGEENIYINGSILGLRMREIKRRFKDIVEFSELGDFINVPLMTYSSGMYMRLGFAIAINVDFDILLIDEMLTVGDLSFQNKCLERLTDFRKSGKTLILVSQSLELLKRLCDKVVLLEKGRVLEEGLPEEVIGFYQDRMSKKTEPVFVQSRVRKPADTVVVSNFGQKTNLAPKEGWGAKIGTKEAEILEVKLLNTRNEETDIFKTGERAKIVVRYTAHRIIEDPHFGVAIFKEDGTYCYGPNTRFDGIKIDKLKPGNGSFSIEYKGLNLLPGKYRLSIAIWQKDERFAYDYHNGYYNFEVISDRPDHGILYLEHSWRINLP
ncbi:MAG: ABC transporter ATP-binding protein [Candidatus Omnitrophota bacterium]